jgi:hypothetical protein
MPTLNLFDALPPSQANQWRRIRAPGGYEWWEFEARDPANDIYVRLSFHDGFAFHPEYARRYDAYRCRPTRQMPPVPREYPCVQCWIQEKDRPVAGFTAHLPAGAFSAEAAANVLTVGSHRLQLDAAETIVRLRSAVPAISADLAFRQNFPWSPMERSFGFCKTARAEHRWVLAQPLCEVEGSIQLDERKIEFSGSGCQDHYYGDAPIASTVGRWLRGWAIGPGGGVIFHVVAMDSGRNQFMAVAADGTEVREIGSNPCSVDWDKRNLRGLAYPSAVQFGERLILRRPRVAEGSRTSLNVVFDAYLDGELRPAWAQIVYPSKLHKRPIYCGLVDWFAGRQMKIFPEPRSVAR